MLTHAATMEIEVDDIGQQVTVTVTNETGHKLPSGYPEGRRIWINVKAWGPNDAYYESGAYNDSTGVLTEDADAKIYEIKPGISHSIAPELGLPAGPSFHFVLNDTIDANIPLLLISVNAWIY